MAEFGSYRASSRTNKYEYPGYYRPYYSPILDFEREQRKAKLQRDMAVSRRVTEDSLTTAGYLGFNTIPVGLTSINRESLARSPEGSIETPSPQRPENSSAQRRRAKVQSEVSNYLTKY